MGTEVLLILLAALASIGAGFFAWLAAQSARHHQSKIERERYEEQLRLMRQENG